MDGGSGGGGGIVAGGGDLGDKGCFSAMGDLPSYEDSVNSPADGHMMTNSYPDTAFPSAGGFLPSAPLMQPPRADPHPMGPGMAPGADPHIMGPGMGPGAYPHPMGPGMTPGAYPQPMGPGMAPGAYPHPMGPGMTPGAYPQPMGPGMTPGAYPQPMGPGVAPGAYQQPMGPGMAPGAYPQPMGPAVAPGNFGQPMSPAQFGMPVSVYNPPPPPGLQPGLVYKSYAVEEPSDDVILSVFEKLATKKSFFFNRPKNLKEKVKIVNKTLEFRLRYTIQTYVEKRRVYSRSNRIIGPHHHSVQSAPMGDMWSYDLRPKDLWWEGTKDKVIQERIDTCTDCFGRCNKPCDHCSGRGRVECIGFHDGNPPCRDCNGTRMRACHWCNGMAYSKCDECDGKGVVNVTVIVEAKFSVKKDFYFDGPDQKVPEKKWQKVTGNDLLSYESAPPVPQLPPYPESTSLNSQANDLLNKHYNKYVASGGSCSETRAIQQKHELTSIPITFVETKYKGKQYNLWVYGTDNEIHCPDLSSCSIL